VLGLFGRESPQKEHGDKHKKKKNKKKKKNNNNNNNNNKISSDMGSVPGRKTQTTSLP